MHVSRPSLFATSSAPITIMSGSFVFSTAADIQDGGRQFNCAD
jgi:hypothetical protein